MNVLSPERDECKKYPTYRRLSSSVTMVLTIALRYWRLISHDSSKSFDTPGGDDIPDDDKMGRKWRAINMCASGVWYWWQRQWQRVRGSNGVATLREDKRRSAVALIAEINARRLLGGRPLHPSRRLLSIPQDYSFFKPLRYNIFFRKQDISLRWQLYRAKTYSLL